MGTFVRRRRQYWVPNPDALVSLTRSSRKMPAHVGVVPPGALSVFPNRATP